MPIALGASECAARADQIRSRLAALDAQYPARRLPEMMRREWDRLQNELQVLGGGRRPRRGYARLSPTITPWEGGEWTRDYPERETYDDGRQFGGTTWRQLMCNTTPAPIVTGFDVTTTNNTDAFTYCNPTARFLTTDEITATGTMTYTVNFTADTTNFEGYARIVGDELLNRQAEMYRRQREAYQARLAMPPIHTIRELSSIYSVGPVCDPPVPRPEPTARERLIQANRWRAREMRARVAQRRAKQLLLDNLTEQQAAEYRANEFFHVETADGRRCYRIHYGLTGNVWVMRDDDARSDTPRENGAIRGYCCHVSDPSIPIEDNLLTQKLWLETREAEFLALANPWNPW